MRYSLRAMLMFVFCVACILGVLRYRQVLHQKERAAKSWIDPVHKHSGFWSCATFSAEPSRDFSWKAAPLSDARHLLYHDLREVRGNRNVDPLNRAAEHSLKVLPGATEFFGKDGVQEEYLTCPATVLVLCRPFKGDISQLNDLFALQSLLLRSRIGTFDVPYSQLGFEPWSDRELCRLLRARFMSRVTILQMPDGQMVTDSSLECLSENLNLQALSLWKNRGITDASVCFLGKLKNLRILCLDGTSIGDKGLKQLAELNNLESLSILNTNVSDAGLLHLSSLKNLFELRVSSPKITADGIRNLQSVLPCLRFVEID